ncbi:helix-turn-helix domain-containing protein [Micromonospora sp. NPDC049559]|uniref:TetR/AcrR family transcriptional regulator n=1 Tax=Micromonospora sp. NPDC049559 TaxID=3155923 RepID=UPI00342741AE
MDNPGRQMRADARRNRERLVAAAREAFTEHGPDAALDEIARRAGVGPGTLYRHFPNRESLLGAVYRGDIEALAEAAEELAAAHPPEEALGRWLGLQLEYARQKRGLTAALKSALAADGETLDWCRTTLRGALGMLLERAQAEGLIRPDVEPTELLRLVHAVAVASEPEPGQAERLLSFVLDGLRSRDGR